MKTNLTIFTASFALSLVFATSANARGNPTENLTKKRCSKKKAYHYWASVDAICNKKGKTYEKKGKKSLEDEKKEEDEISKQAEAVRNQIMNDQSGANGAIAASDQLASLQMEANKNMAPRCQKAMDEFKKQCPGQFKGSLEKAQKKMDEYQEMADATQQFQDDQLQNTNDDTRDSWANGEESAQADDSVDPKDHPVWDDPKVKDALERYNARKEAENNNMSPLEQQPEEKMSLWEQQQAKEKALEEQLRNRAELQRSANPDPEVVAQRKEQERLDKFLPPVDPNRAAKQAQREEMAKQLGNQPVGADKNRKIDPVHFAERARQKVAESSLANKTPPKYMQNLGVKKGTPEEWAEFMTKMTRQESGLRTAKVNPNGTLRRFSSTIPTEKSFGPGQFNKGEYGLRTWSDVNNPDRVIDAYINVAKKGNLYRYFGSIQRPREIRQHSGWYNRVVRPRTSWTRSAVSSPSRQRTAAPTQRSIILPTQKKSAYVPSPSYDPIRDHVPVNKTAFNNEDGLDAEVRAQKSLAQLDICQASRQIRDIASSDSEVFLKSAAGMSSQVDEVLAEKGYPAGALGIDMYCQNQ